MHRAWQRLLSVFVLLFALLAPLSAQAFHAGSVYDKPPGAGGGGGIFYTGAPLEHGWKCDLCHLAAPGKVRVRMHVEPSELFDTFVYVPGQTYTFTATLEGETLGMGSPLSNFNAIGVSITDTKGLSVGSIGAFAPDVFYAGGATTIASAGQKPGETQWKFAYTAPLDAAGPVLVHIAAVDGNGADSPPTKTLTDPFGDDVFAVTITLAQGGLASAPSRTPSVAMGPLAAPNPGAPRAPSVAMGPLAAPNPGAPRAPSVAMGPQAAPNPGAPRAPDPGHAPLFVVAIAALGAVRRRSRARAANVSTRERPARALDRADRRDA